MNFILKLQFGGVKIKISLNYEGIIMKITDITVKPQKKTADVWDAVTETSVKNSAASEAAAHLVTYILNENDITVGKTETDFTAKPHGCVLVVQSVLTYSPLLSAKYKIVSELYKNDVLLSEFDQDFIFSSD